MTSRPRLVALIAAFAAPCVIVPLVLPVSSASGRAAHPTVTPASAQRAAVSHTVTLITGDVVHFTELAGGRSTVSVTRPRAAVGGVRQETIGGHVFVIPDEALPYLAAHRVDRRLFDVTGLVEQGYDDAHSNGIPLIVRYDSASAPAALPGTTTVRTLPSVGGAALRATKSRARGLWTTLTPETRRARPSLRSLTPGTPAAARPQQSSLLGAGVSAVWLDGRVHATLAESTLQIGAPTAWSRGFTGKGVKVAVLDTGYDQAHPDLTGRVVATKSFVPGQTVQDGNGHGTHTSSTVGGSGAASGGLEKGVAPDSDLIIGKVLADEGYGDDSWVIAGMEWAASQGARVVSMSLGGDTPSDGTEPVCAAVNDISAASGTLFVVAAGNAGAEGTISCPGAADAALTVAAVDNTDTMAYFSSQGPRSGDYALKPDIAAPGVDILAARAGGNATDGWYVAESGTSMATPHVAGAAADLAQQHPDWTGPQLKDALMSTAKPIDGGAYHVGSGRVDLDAATSDTITATGSTYLGFFAWPHPNPAPVSKVITYRNSGATPVTLQLAEDVTIAGGPYDVDPAIDAGNPAPAGMFSLSADHVTVPAHGVATVTANGIPALGQSARRYLGQVVATSTSGTVLARTQVALYEEEERYNLTFDVRDRSGKAAAAYVELQKFGSPDVSVVPVDESGVMKLRLLPGTYSVLAYLDVPGAHGPDSHGVAQLGDPEVILDRDRVVSLDARKAVQVTATVPRVTEDRVLYLDWYRSDGSTSVMGSQYMLPSSVDTMYAMPTRRVTQGSFEFEARWRKAFPLLTITDRGRPLSVIGQAGSSLYDGQTHLRVVDAGEGTAADYAGLDVKGALAVVRHSASVDSMTRAQNAADAGAAMLVVVADTDKAVLEYVGTPDGANSAIPVVALGNVAGTALLARAASGHEQVAVRGVPNSPYVYDLVAPYPNRIPSRLHYAPRASQLATVDVRFHGDKVAPGGEFRWDYRPYRISGFGFPLVQSTGLRRTDYVSAQPGTTWAEAAVGGPNLSWVESSDVHALTAGRRTTLDWFAPVVHPSNGGGFWSSTRYGGFIALNVQPWSDGGSGHAGYMQFDDTKHLDVYQDGVKVASSDWASATLTDLPDGPLHYKLDLTTSRSATDFTFSPRTRTRWDLVSPGITKGLDSVDLLPLLQADYDVRTDLAGYAHDGLQTVRFRVHHLADAVGAGRITRTSLAISADDGTHWRQVTATRGADGWFTARFAAKDGAYVSLRVSGRDDRGNTIRQEIVRAYGVR